MGLTVDADESNLVFEFVKAQDGRVEEATSTTTTTSIDDTVHLSTSMTSSMNETSILEIIGDKNDDSAFWIWMAAGFGLICVCCSLLGILIVIKLKNNSDALLDTNTPGEDRNNSNTKEQVNEHSTDGNNETNITACV